MRARQSNEWDFVHSGPTTLAGRYLRRFWQPIYESDKLKGGQAVPIHALNELFTLYRGENGTAHLVAGRCPHRLTQLSTGWIEGDSIRCFFHGWKFNHLGSCEEQPAEPKPFCDKIKIAAYPTQEQLGLVFAFLGEGPPPPLPQWPELASEPVTSMAMIPCNYFQSAENIVDDVHVGFTHRAAPELGVSPRGGAPRRVSAKETSFGLTIFYHHEDGHIEQNHYLMPNLCYVKYLLVYRGASGNQFRAPMQTLFWYVPIDDVTHQHVMVTNGPEFVLEGMRRESLAHSDVAEEIAAILAGESDYHKRVPGPGQRKSDLVRIQDGVTIVGQGAILDRSNERLGASDVGVTLLRKIWIRELRKLAAKKDLTPFARPQNLEEECP